MSHEIRFVFQITPLKNSFCHSLSNSKQVFLQEKKLYAIPKMSPKISGVVHFQEKYLL